jgi:hypothetical protein
VWWYTPVIPALRRLMQEEHEFEASLGYINKRNKQKMQAGRVAQVVEQLKW